MANPRPDHYSASAVTISLSNARTRVTFTTSVDTLTSVWPIKQVPRLVSKENPPPLLQRVVSWAMRCQPGRSLVSSLLFKHQTNLWAPIPKSHKWFQTVLVEIRLLFRPRRFSAVSLGKRNLSRRWTKRMHRSWGRDVTRGRPLLGQSSVVPFIRRCS